MKGKHRTPLPRSPARKRTPRSKPAPPRAKGEIERLAVRRCAAMKYRLAGASYRTIAEKLTEERAQAYAVEHGVSVERAMKKITHVSVRTVWDDVTAEYEKLRRETEVNRADSMALQNARLDQVFSKALSLFSKGGRAGWSTGDRDDGAPGEVERSGRADEDRAHGPDRRAPGRHRGDRRQHAERGHASARAAG